MARLAAADPLLLAQTYLDELQLDQSRPIDVLEALARLDLITTIVDLGEVLGVVVPQGGVMLTSRRGETVQRYTAAHEIGHWVMHRDSLLVDTQQEINGEPTSQQERQAQLFASYFLMPPPLLMDSLAQRDLRPQAVTAGQVYLLARDMHVSYEAALVRLLGEGYLTLQSARAYRTIGRASARAEAFAGRRPADGYAELWSVQMTDTRRLHVTVGDEILVQLPENRTTPYRWATSTEQTQPPLRATRRPKPPAASELPGDESPATPPSGRAPVAARKAALQLVPDGGTRPADGGSTIESVGDGALSVTADAFRLAGWESPATLRARRRALAASPASPAAHNTPTRAVGDTAAAAFGERLLQVQCRQEGEHELLLHYRHGFTADLPPAATWQLLVEVAASLTTKQRRRLLDVDLDERQPGDPDDDAQFG